jgi:hypothetical protein
MSLVLREKGSLRLNLSMSFMAHSLKTVGSLVRKSYRLVEKMESQEQIHKVFWREGLPAFKVKISTHTHNL